MASWIRLVGVRFAEVGTRFGTRSSRCRRAVLLQDNNHTSRAREKKTPTTRTITSLRSALNRGAERRAERVARLPPPAASCTSRWVRCEIALSCVSSPHKWRPRACADALKEPGQAPILTPRLFTLAAVRRSSWPCSSSAHTRAPSRCGPLRGQRRLHGSRAYRLHRRKNGRPPQSRLHRPRP